MHSKTAVLLLQRLAAIGQTEVARVTGVDNTQLSHFVGGDRGLRIDQIEPVLAALGLKVVGSDSVSIPEPELEALRVLSRKALEPNR